MPIYPTGPAGSDTISICGTKYDSLISSNAPAKIKGLQKEVAGVYGSGYCDDFVFVKPAVWAAALVALHMCCRCCCYMYILYRATLQVCGRACDAGVWQTAVYSCTHKNPTFCNPLLPSLLMCLFLSYLPSPEFAADSCLACFLICYSSRVAFSSHLPLWLR